MSDGGAELEDTLSQVLETATAPLQPLFTDEFRAPARQVMAYDSPAPAPGVFPPNPNGPLPPPTPGPTKPKLKTADEIYRESELAAKSNAAANKPWAMADIQKDPKGFVGNLTQLDGDPTTKSDEWSCGQTALLGGALLSDPKSVQDLGKKLQSPAGQKEFPSLAKPPASESVARLASGTFSANDVRVVSNKLHDEMQYTGDDGELTQGTPSAREFALLGKLQKIGWTPPAMEMNTFGDAAHQLGNHKNAYANGTGYDPWPNSKGKAVLTDGHDKALAHGQQIPRRYGRTEDYQLLDSKKLDGKGHLVWERSAVGGKPISPPLKASYSFDAKQNAWVRDPVPAVDPKYDSAMPKVMPLDTEKRKKLGSLEVDD